MIVRVKICGLTRFDEALAVCLAGCHAIGFVFVSRSPRFVTREDVRSICEKLPPFVQTVGVFVDEERDTIKDIMEFCGLDICQLHGEESPEFCRFFAPRVVKAFRVKDESILEQLKLYRGSVRAILIDSWSQGLEGGTGKVFDWHLAKKITSSTDIPVILAGGLNPENIGKAVRQVQPWAVDVSSGVEISPGRKDIEKVRLFIKNVSDGIAS